MRGIDIVKLLHEVKAKVDERSKKLVRTYFEEYLEHDEEAKQIAENVFKTNSMVLDMYVDALIKELIYRTTTDSQEDSTVC